MLSPHRLNQQWHIALLPRSTQRALERLSHAVWLKKDGWYLAGGTAMALQAGHRQSVDLDFFTRKPEFSQATLIHHFREDEWTANILRQGTLYGTLLGAKTSFIAYPFFIPRKPCKWYGAVPVLDIDDIAVMKIVAISQRGRKRDFVDLYWYCVKKKPMLNVIQCLPGQYPDVAHNYWHILKSLTYFDDAEEDPMPKLFFKATWSDIKKFFKKEVPQVTKKLLRLS